MTRRSTTSTSSLGLAPHSSQKCGDAYMLVVGDREMADGTVSLRRRDGTKDNGLSFDTFLSMVRDRIAHRSLEL